MSSLQKERYEAAMDLIHREPVTAYRAAIIRHQSAIKRLERMIKKLESHKK